MIRLLRETLWNEGSGLLTMRWFPPAAFVLLGVVLVASSVLTPEGEAAAWGYDFKAFRAGAEMTLRGDLASAYDAAAFADALSAPGQDMYWMYAPHGSMIFALLALPPYEVAGLMLFVLIAGTCFATGRSVGGGRREGALLSLFSIPAVFALLLGQAAPLFGALLVFALWRGQARPLLAGAALALLTVKPQYGLMVPVFLLAHGQWRTIAAAAGGTVGLVAASLVLLGTAPWAALLANADGPARDFIYENLYASMPALHHYVRFLGVPDAGATAIQAAAVPLGMVLVWLTRALPRPTHVALTLLVTCATMPYLWFYDWLPVMAAVLILARADAPGVRAPTWLLVAVWITPLASEAQEALLGVTPRLLALPVTNAVNVLEMAAMWGLIAVLAYPAIRTTALPVFAPSKRPMKASGPASTPS